MSSRKLVRTSHPGIYSRGGSFVVVWRGLNKKQHKTFVPSLSEAVSAQRKIKGELEKARMLRRPKPPKSRGDVSSGYSLLRKTLQIVNNAHESARGDSRKSLEAALARLHAAEDQVVKAMKETR